ncbi:hypothetical protein LTR17_011448 [Elasticomyces elasticus]|nr:hypothetical protein LTR17_011448 [Elasticomyces elasticus]
MGNSLSAFEEELGRAMSTAKNDNYPKPCDVCCICGAQPKVSGGTLLCCGRCRQVRYCGKECQAKDWEFHKQACKTLATPHKKGAPAGLLPDADHLKGKETAWPAMLIEIVREPQSPNGFGFRYSGSVLQDMDAGHWKFQPLAITEVLGLPLAQASSPTTGKQRIPNVAIEFFSIDPDPWAPGFGRPVIAPGPPCGLLFVRRDGRNLHSLHLCALIDYLQIDCREIINVMHMENAGHEVDREALASRLLTPVAFAAAFERMREKEVSEGHIGWADVENPVQQK